MTGRSLHLLSDILMIGLCTYLTGGTDYERLDRRRQPTGFQGLAPVIPIIISIFANRTHGKNEVTLFSDWMALISI